MPTRAERRAETNRIKAKFRRIAYAYEMPADDPRWLGKVAAMHFTCPCGMCTSELKHSRPEQPKKDARLLQDETQTADSKRLSQWFASRPDARRRAREAAEDYRSSD